MKPDHGDRDHLIAELADLRQRIAELETMLARHEQLKQRLQESEQTVKHVHRMVLALSRAAQAVQQAGTRDDVYHLMSEEVRKLGLQIAIFNVAEDRTFLTLHYVTSWQRAQRVIQWLLGRSPMDIRIPLAPDGFFQSVIERGESRFCEDNAALSARGFPGLGRAVFDKLLATLGMSRSIYAPLVVGGQTRQLLSVFGDALTEADEPAVTAFANQAAIALENARLLEELTATNERLRHLAQRVVVAQEEERQRLSRALHDEAGQALTALRISLELLRVDLADDACTLRARLDDAVTLTTETMEQLRFLSQSLRPPALDAVGLNQALEGFCRDFARRIQIPVDYFGAETPPLPEPVSISLYRLLQEALTNAARHARASRISVSLHDDPAAISLSVQDDGQGFDEQAVLSASGHALGIGLLGLRERLEMLGGRLEISSHPGQGTRLVGCIPLRNTDLASRGCDD